MFRKKPCLDVVVRRIGEISTLPHIALRLMEGASDPNVGASDIRQVMEGDPVLSARVLRCVNSSAYGLRTKTTNLQQAIAYLGLKQVRNLAMAAGMSHMFRKEETIGPFRRWALWKHMVSVGIGARLIAMRLGISQLEDMFLAGLLHDIGIILEDQYMHNLFSHMICNLDPWMTLAGNEQVHLGFDHTRLGAEVARKWQFPEIIQDAIRYHHASEDYQGEGVRLVRCVEVANILCSLKGISSVGVNLVKPSFAVIRALDLGKEDLVALSQDLDRELEENKSLLYIGADSHGNVGSG